MLGGHTTIRGQCITAGGHTQPHGALGWDKLLSTLHGSYWWLGMHVDIANCIQHYSVCLQDKLPTPPNEELCWMDQGGALLIGWSINVEGPFLQDEDRNNYLLATMDPFYK